MDKVVVIVVELWIAAVVAEDMCIALVDRMCEDIDRIVAVVVADMVEMWVAMVFDMVDRVFVQHLVVVVLRNNLAADMPSVAVIHMAMVA